MFDLKYLRILTLDKLFHGLYYVPMYMIKKMLLSYKCKPYSLGLTNNQIVSMLYLCWIGRKLGLNCVDWPI